MSRMALYSQRRQEAELARLHRAKQSRPMPDLLLGPQLVHFFKTSVQKRQGKFAQIAQVWSQLVPPLFNDRCALESFSRGTLNVIVDSSSHLYELKQLLLAGLQKQLLLACRGAGLRKVTLKIGRWYDGDEPANRKLRFD